MLVTSYVIPEGHVSRFNHMDGWVNLGKDEMWNRAIQQGAPKTISELNTLLRLLFGISGCVGCGINKESAIDVLFNHSQDSSFVPTQVTENDEDTYTSMESASKSAPSWPVSNIRGTLADSEKALYKNFRIDCSSDESYKPRKTRNHGHIDVPLTMDGNKNTKATGFGYSKWAGELESSSNPIPEPEKPVVKQLPTEIGEGRQKPPSTVPYTQCEQTTPEEAIKEVLEELSLWERMGRLDSLVISMRDELDDLKEFKEEIEIKGCGKCR